MLRLIVTANLSEEEKEVIKQAFSQEEFDVVIFDEIDKKLLKAYPDKNAYLVESVSYKLHLLSLSDIIVIDSNDLFSFAAALTAAVIKPHDIKIYALERGQRDKTAELILGLEKALENICIIKSLDELITKVSP